MLATGGFSKAHADYVSRLVIEEKFDGGIEADVGAFDRAVPQLLAESFGAALLSEIEKRAVHKFADVTEALAGKIGKKKFASARLQLLGALRHELFEAHASMSEDLHPARVHQDLSVEGPVLFRHDTVY